MKKDSVLNQLTRFVKARQYKSGDKFPPERELAEMLSTSRATVREALRVLEERGVVVVKRSSGTYLNKSPETIDGGNDHPEIDENKLIKDQLEAYFMIVPLMVRRAAARGTAEEIKQMQDCIVTMSRAIVAKELKSLQESDKEFHRLLAVMTGNYKLLPIMEQLNTGREFFWEYVIQLDEFVNSVIFAGYVEIVNALKDKEAEAAEERVKRNIIHACQQISRIKNIDFCGVLEDRLP